MIPVVVPTYNNIEDVVNVAKRVAQEELALEEKDLILITGGFPLGKSHATNMLRIEEIIKLHNPIFNKLNIIPL